MTAVPQTQTEILLTIPPRAEFLALCRLVIAGVAQTHAVDPEVLADLKLAVTEACSNAIRHAYAEGEGDVEIRYEIAADAISIEVADSGAGFELAGRERTLDPTVDGLSEDGMGIAIIGALMDELVVMPGPGGRGSRFRFTKYL